MNNETLNQKILARNLSDVLQETDCKECFLINFCKGDSTICDSIDKTLEGE